MALSDKESDLNARVNLDGKEAKKTLTELQKLVENLNKDIDTTGKKFSAATKNFNKMLSTSMVQYKKILAQTGAGNPEQLSALAFQKQQTKQLNSLYSVNPNRANAQLAQVNNKIARDAATVFSDTLTKRLSQYGFGFSNSRDRLGISTSMYQQSGAYRGMVDKAFSQYEAKMLASIGTTKEAASIKALERVKKLYTETLDPINQQIAASEKLQRVGGGALALIQAKLIANYAVINSVTRAFSYLTGYVVEFDQELKNLQAITAVSDAGLEALKNSIIDVANATKFTSLEITRAAVVLGQAGLSVQQIKDTLGPIAELATATGTDLATSTQTITSALNIYNLQADEAKYVTNALTTAMNESKAEIKGFQYALQYAGNTAANLGVSFEETAAATAAMAQSGIKSVSTQGTGLRAVFTELIKPTKKFQDQLAKIGLTMADVDVKTRGFIPVLKTMKEAGFGVTEAYKGMERRGAAAMTAILNQIELMDDLTEKMTLSTAATKANQTQMEGLKNTFANTQSVVGSLAYEGFEPLIRISQSLLEAFNNLAKSNGNVIASFISMLAIGTGLAGMVGLVAKTIGQIIVLGKSLLAAKTAAGGLAAAFAGGSLLAYAGAAAAIGAVAAAAYSLYKSLDSVGRSYEKTASIMEDKQGEINKAQESYDAFSNVISRAFVQREKFSGPEGQKELNKFVNMIITRFPQIADIMKEPIKSFEELADRLLEAQIRLANFNAEAARGSSKAARDLTREAARVMQDRLSVEDKNKQVSILQQYGIIDKNTADSLRVQQEESRSPVTKFLSGIDVASILERLNPYGNIASYGVKAGRAGIEAYKASRYAATEKESASYIAALESQYEKRGQEFLDDLMKLLSDSTSGLTDETRDLITKFLDQQKTIEQENSKNLQNMLDKSFDAVIQGVMKVTSSDLTALRAKLTDLSTSGNYSSAEISAGVAELTMAAETRLNYLQKGSIEDMVKFMGTDIQSLANTYTKGNLDKVKQALTDKTSKIYQEITSNYVEFVAELSNINSEVIKQEAKKAQRESDRKFKEGIRSLTSKPLSSLDAERSKLEREAELDFLKQKAALEEGRKDIVKAITFDEDLADLTASYENKRAQIKSEVEKVKSTFDRNAESQNAYFKALNSSIDDINKKYEKAIADLENRYRYREGLVTGYGLMGASIEESAGRSRIELDQRRDYQTRYNLAFTTRKDLNERRTSLIKSLDYREIKQNLEETERVFNNLRNSTTATADQIKEARKNYEEAARAEEKYTSTINDLDVQIKELEGTMLELQGTIDAINKLESNENINQAFINSFTNARDSYASQNTYFNSGLNFATGELFGQTWYTGLNEAEGALTNFFDVAINGTEKTGDAFRDMCNGILRAMEQTFYSETAKLFLSRIFGGDDSSGNPTGLLGLVSSGIGSLFGGGVVESGGVTGSGGFFTASHGGLVKGGIANRDSINARLMPGEYVMRKSAVEAVGTDFLSNLNAGNTDFLTSTSEGLSQTGEKSSGTKNSTMNIWVVTPDQVPQEDPDNIIATVSRDIKTNGTIKQLIKQVSMGG